jgi:hypothetical protein
MAKSIFRKIVVAGIALGALGGPTAAYAEWGQQWVEPFNDGNGTCGYLSCGPHGCTPLIIFPCPREVRGDL